MDTNSAHRSTGLALSGKTSATEVLPACRQWACWGKAGLQVKGCACACARRFQTTFLGSRAVTGDLVGLGMLDAEDRNGETLADVLYKHGYQGSEEALQRTAYEPGQIRGWVVVACRGNPCVHTQA